MTVSTKILNEDIYVNLPEEYNSFKKPRWDEPYLIELSDRSYDINSGNLLNIAYWKINDFTLDGKDAINAPIYYQSLIGFIEAAQNGKINISGKDIDFFGDIWDFREFAKSTQSKHHYCYYIKNYCLDLSDYYETALRFFLFYAITDKGIKASSIFGNFRDVRNILLDLQDYGVSNLRNLTVSDLEKVFDNPEWIYTTKTKKMFSLKYFLSIYSFLFEDIYSKQISDYLSEIDREKIKAITATNKLPLLPTEIFKNLEKVLIRILNSEKYNETERMQAGLILIDMQTGLRPSELVNLKKTSLEITKIDDKVVGTLTYPSAKSHNKKDKFVSTIATPLTIQIFEKLKSFDPSNKCEYIGFRNDFVHFRLEGLNSILRKFCLENCIEIGLVNHKEPKYFSNTVSLEHACSKMGTNRKIPEGLNPTDLISLPSFTQFRVYFASEWRARGVDDRRISSMLGQSVEMWGYYVRGAGEIQEEKQKTDELLKEYIQGQTSLLGPRAKAFEDKINKFLEKNKFNVNTDVNIIIEQLSDEIEIRIKKGGFCIHSNKRRSCQYDAETDEYFCAYGCCPNHVHTYFSSPITYSKFLEAVKVVEYNRENGFLRQTEKELKKLKTIINLELIPELTDLELQLKKFSIEEIIKRHPDTKIVINNLESIKQEISHWLEITEESDRLIKENMHE